jgi:pimeloyl-ACP methyl ester carboxylesterase
MLTPAARLGRAGRATPHTARSFPVTPMRPCYAGPADRTFSRPGYEIPQQLVDDVRGMTYPALTATSRATDDYLKQRPLPDRLKVLGKPLLVIFGKEDQRWRSSSATEYRAVPGARVELLPGVGHSPMLEDPPRTAAPLLSFTTAQHPNDPGQ